VGSSSRVFESRELDDDTTILRCSRKLRRCDGFVYAKPPFVGPEHALAYFGAYTLRIAISNQRILSVEQGHIAFRHLDSADTRKTEDVNGSS
jgi:hypothetical protein